MATKRPKKKRFHRNERGSAVLKNLLGRVSERYHTSANYEEAVASITEFFDTLIDEEVYRKRFAGTDNNVTELFMNSLFVYCNMFMSLSRQCSRLVDSENLFSSIDTIVAVCDLLNFRSTVVSKDGAGLFPLSPYEKSVMKDLMDVHLEFLDIASVADIQLAMQDTIKNIVTSKKNTTDPESAVLTNYDFWGVYK